jgi:hypothetical protein
MLDIIEPFTSISKLNTTEAGVAVAALCLCPVNSSVHQHASYECYITDVRKKNNNASALKNITGLLIK